MAGRKREKRKGLLITFEGGEGVGKTTQIKRLGARLKKAKLPVVFTLQPGGTRIGKQIRDLLLNPKHERYNSRTELLLYLADRAHHVENLIRPALAAGKIVISDRYTDSSTVYQGICRGLGQKCVEDLNAFATAGLEPDITILLDLSHEVGLARARKRFRLDRLEQEKAAFHRQVRAGYKRLARKHKRIFTVDASRSIDDIAREIEKLVLER